MAFQKQFFSMSISAIFLFFGYFLALRVVLAGGGVAYKEDG